MINALEIQGKTLETAKLVCLGAGSAGIATLHLLGEMGLKKENILLVDRVGLITTDREGMGDIKAVFAMKTDKKTLADAMHGADVFIGVASANLVTQDMVKSMADKPIVFALQ